MQKVTHFDKKNAFKPQIIFLKIEATKKLVLCNFAMCENKTISNVNSIDFILRDKKFSFVCVTIKTLNCVRNMITRKSNDQGNGEVFFNELAFSNDQQICDNFNKLLIDSIIEINSSQMLMVVCAV